MTPFSLVPLDSIPPEEIVWVWPGYIPASKITLLVGDPGVGKSYLTHDIAARYSRGADWPDRQAGTGRCGRVVILSAEDAAGDTIVPRLAALGAIHQNIAVPKEEDLGLLTDFKSLRTAMSDFGAALLIIDPLNAYLGRADGNKGTDVRRVLAPLSLLAREMGVAVVLVHHPNKNVQMAASYRASGSIDIAAQARSVLWVVRDSADENVRYLFQGKANLVGRTASLAFTIHDRGLEWFADRTVRLDLQSAMEANAADASCLAEAAEFIENELAGGTEVRAVDMYDRARHAGIARRTLDRARRQVGVRWRRQGGRYGYSVWYLPRKERDDTEQ